MTWQLQPEELGAAIAGFIDEESLPFIAERLLQIKIREDWNRQASVKLALALDEC